jgi:general secretion pathway protein K
MRTDATRSGVHGGALLAVLWLSVALSAIAFSVATSVRGETERTATGTDSLRAYYLAAGSVDRAILWIYWGTNGGYSNPDGSPRYYRAPMPYIRYSYPTGDVLVEVIPGPAS